jgi:hypothetical protein
VLFVQAVGDPPDAVPLLTQVEDPAHDLALGHVHLKLFVA